jgi:hypothetical protein
MGNTTNIPRWADPKAHHARSKLRFKLYGFNEICRMTTDEWDEECRRNGADMEEHPEEVAIRELAALHAMKVIKT